MVFKHVKLVKIKFIVNNTYILEAAGAPHDGTLPVVFDTTDDPTLNNLTRSDVNCDKRGTCYDGNNITNKNITEIY